MEGLCRVKAFMIWISTRSTPPWSPKLRKKAGPENHLGIYPGDGGVSAFKTELEGCGLKYSKGAIQFPYDKVDLELIGRIAEWCGRNNG